MSSEAIHYLQSSGSELLGPSGVDPAACLSAAAVNLGQSLGDGRRLVSMTLALATEPAANDRIDMTGWIDKRTRSLAFARLEARRSADLVFSVTAIYATKGASGE